MNALILTSSAVGNLGGFVAKQFVTYHSIDTVREQLQALISKVASNHFGGFIGTFIGDQTGVLFSVPITCLLADLVGSAVKETVQTVICVAGALLFGLQPIESKSRPFFKEICLKIIRFATYLFSKSYFCNYGMPFVKQGVEFCLRHVVTISIAAIPVAFTTSIAVSTLAIIITPPLTFLLGDLIGYLAGELTYELCGRVSAFLLD